MWGFICRMGIAAGFIILTENREETLGNELECLNCKTNQRALICHFLLTSLFLCLFKLEFWDGKNGRSVFLQWDVIISCTHAWVYNQNVICPHTFSTISCWDLHGICFCWADFYQMASRFLKRKPVIPELQLSKESRYVICVGNMMAGSFHSLMDLSDWPLL